MQEPKAPYWNPNLPRWAVQDIDRYIKNGIQNYGDVLNVVNSVGGVGAYRQMAADFERADAQYQIDHAKWQMEQAKARGATATSGEERWLGYYYDQAAKSNVFSEPERKQFAQQAETTKASAAENKAKEDRAYYLRQNANQIRDRLLKNVVPDRMAEYDRLDAERETQRELLNAARQIDIAEAQKALQSGMITGDDYRTVVGNITARYSASLEDLSNQFRAAYGAAQARETALTGYADQLYDEIVGGNFDPEKQYALPAFEYSPATLAANYKPTYLSSLADVQKYQEEKARAEQAATNPTPVTPARPGTPGASTPTTPATSTPNIPSMGSTTPAGNITPAGNTAPAGNTTPSQPAPPPKIEMRETPRVVRAPTRNANDLVARARVVDQSTQPSAATTGGGVVQQPQPQPGLINNAGLLNYTPTINAPAGTPGLLTNQNPMLYIYGAPGVRLPGQMQTGG